MKWYRFNRVRHSVETTQYPSPQDWSAGGEPKSHSPNASVQERCRPWLYFKLYDFVDMWVVFNTASKQFGDARLLFFSNAEFQRTCCFRQFHVMLEPDPASCYSLHPNFPKHVRWHNKKTRNPIEIHMIITWNYIWNYHD